jgi:hypothetical protein
MGIAWAAGAFTHSASPPVHLAEHVDAEAFGTSPPRQVLARVAAPRGVEDDPIADLRRQHPAPTPATTPATSPPVMWGSGVGSRHALAGEDVEEVEQQAFTRTTISPGRGRDRARPPRG